MAADAPHGFVVEDYNIKTGIIPAGGHEIIQFTDDKTGTFNFYSYIGNRNDIGVIGKQK